METLNGLIHEAATKEEVKNETDNRCKEVEERLVEWLDELKHDMSEQLDSQFSCSAPKKRSSPSSSESDEIRPPTKKMKENTETGETSQAKKKKMKKKSRKGERNRKGKCNTTNLLF